MDLSLTEWKRNIKGEKTMHKSKLENFVKNKGGGGVKKRSMKYFPLSVKCES